MSYTLNVIDAVTSLPIVGAKAYVVYTGPKPASPVVLVSDSSGNFSIAAGLATIVIKALGYQDQVVSNLATTIVMTAATVPGISILFSVEPKKDQTGLSATVLTAGVAISVQNASGTNVDNLIVGTTGTVQSSALYAPGTYSVTLSGSGFNALTQTMTVSIGASDQVFTLTTTTTALSSTTAQTDPGNASAVAEATAAATAYTAADDSYEFIYPNSVDGKYFQAAQARMYIGKHFVDELNSCQWMVAQNQIPVYGYRSKKFDAVGTGRSLVQGQLAINFISEGYMYILLKDFEKRISSKLSAVSSDPTFPDSLKNSINGLFAARTNALAAGTSTKTLDTLLFTAGKSSASAHEYIASLVSGSTTSAAKDSANTTLKYGNAVYLNIPFDIEVKLAGAGRTVLKKLTNCFLGANDFTFAHDGRTLTETYSFIARDVS